MISLLKSRLNLIRNLILISLFGCTASDLKPPVLELTFYGEECAFSGPTKFKSGSVTIRFINKSEAPAAANLLKHAEGHGLEEMMEIFKEEPSTAHHPDWSTEIIGVWKVIEAGESHNW